MAGWRKVQAGLGVEYLDVPGGKIYRDRSGGLGVVPRQPEFKLEDGDVVIRRSINGWQSIQRVGEESVELVFEDKEGVGGSMPMTESLERLFGSVFSHLWS